MTHVRVLLFARAKDLAGASAVELDLPAGATVRDLRRALAEARPALTSLLERSAIAVNDEFAGDDQDVPPDATVALLPPVSGGSGGDGV
jgi:molybdopterin converting factor subunit 1